MQCLSRSQCPALFHAMALLLLAASVVEGAETAQVRVRRFSTGQVRHSAQKKAFKQGYLRDNLKTICEETECPPLEQEVIVQSMGIALRKYKSAEWVAYTNDSWMLKPVNSMTYAMEHFMKLIDFQMGDNHLQKKLGYTTPVVNELVAIKKRKTNPESDRMQLKEGLIVRLRIPSKYQGDPYVEPTDRKISLSAWTPTEEGGSNEWVLVHQFKQDPQDEVLPNMQYEMIRTKLRNKLSAEGSPDLEPPFGKFYYVSWGSPANRIYEIWIPVSNEVASVLVK